MGSFIQHTPNSSSPQVGKGQNFSARHRFRLVRHRSQRRHLRQNGVTDGIALLLLPQNCICAMRSPWKIIARRSPSRPAPGQMAADRKSENDRVRCPPLHQKAGHGPLRLPVGHRRQHHPNLSIKCHRTGGICFFPPLRRASGRTHLQKCKSLINFRKTSPQTVGNALIFCYNDNDI